MRLTIIEVLTILFGGTTAASNPIAFTSDAPAQRHLVHQAQSNQQQLLKGDDGPSTSQAQSEHIRLTTMTNNPPEPSHTYTCFYGAVANYPDQESWLEWGALWSLNWDTILASNDGNESLCSGIRTAIEQVAAETHVDQRLILALIMQTTRGRAAAACITMAAVDPMTTTTTGLEDGDGDDPAFRRRCGILQAHNGHGFDQPGTSVLAMVREGIAGRSWRGPGYAMLLEGVPRIENLPLGNPYAAARMYDSGVVGSDLDVVERGSAEFANDFANRLVGWDGTGEGFSICYGEL